MDVNKLMIGFELIGDGKSRNPMLVNRLPVLESEINKQIDERKKNSKF